MLKDSKSKTLSKTVPFLESSEINQMYLKPVQTMIPKNLSLAKHQQTAPHVTPYHNQTSIDLIYFLLFHKNNEVGACCYHHHNHDRGLKACRWLTNILPPVSISESVFYYCGYHAHCIGKKSVGSNKHFTTCLLFQTGVFLLWLSCSLDFFRLFLVAVVSAPIRPILLLYPGLGLAS